MGTTNENSWAKYGMGGPHEISNKENRFNGMAHYEESMNGKTFSSTLSDMRKKFLDLENNITPQTPKLK